MKRELILTTQPIIEPTLQSQRQISASSGAVVCFLGVARGTEQAQTIVALEYEAFVAMAERQFNLLFDELERRWPIESVRLVHRLGIVNVGEASLWIEVIAAHRQEAFAACQYLINELKRLVPIWKKPIAA